MVQYDSDCKTTLGAPDEVLVFRLYRLHAKKTVKSFAYSAISRLAVLKSFLSTDREP